MNWKFWTWPKQIRDNRAEAELCRENVKMHRKIANNNQDRSFRLQIELDALKDRLSMRDEYPAVPLDDPEWSVADDEALKSFIHNTETGKRFMNALQFMSQYQQRGAVLTKTDRDHSCGRAAGWHNCVGYILQLSSKPKLSNGQPAQSSDGAAELRERLAP